MITGLVNSTAGAHATPGDIAAAFEAAGASARIVAVTPGDDIVALARNAAETSDVVVAAGGDGTVNAVASVVVGTAVTMGVLPLGTHNHFAKDMKLPSSLDEAVAVIVAGRVTSVDAAEVNGRLFVNNSSIGVYPNAVAIRDQLREAGRRKWIAMVIAIWRVLRTYRGVHVRLTANGRTLSARTPFVFVGNNEYVLEGLQAGVRERLTGGQLFVYLAPRIATRQLPMLVLRALCGRAHPPGTFEKIPASDLEIETSGATHMTVSLDGETSTLKMPLHYRARPDALRVIA